MNNFYNNFYIVQWKEGQEGRWFDTIIILRGSIQRHLVVIERFQLQSPQVTYRLKRIPEEQVVRLC